MIFISKESEKMPRLSAVQGKPFGPPVFSGSRSGIVHYLFRVRKRSKVVPRNYLIIVSSRWCVLYRWSFTVFTVLPEFEVLSAVAEGIVVLV